MRDYYTAVDAGKHVRQSGSDGTNTTRTVREEGRKLTAPQVTVLQSMLTSFWALDKSLLWNFECLEDLPDNPGAYECTLHDVQALSPALASQAAVVIDLGEVTP